MGVFDSIIETALNAKGEFILFIDPDDMLLNPFLFEELYNYNLKYAVILAIMSKAKFSWSNFIGDSGNDLHYI